VASAVNRSLLVHWRNAANPSVKVAAVAASERKRSGWRMTKRYGETI